MKTAIPIEIESASDIDLLAAIAMQADDRETAMLALTELHTRHSSMCLGFATKRQSHGVDPESVVSKTFQKVWEKAETFDPDKRGKKVSKGNAAKNWLFQILENHINTDIRERAALEEVSLLDGFGTTGFASHAPDEEEQAAEEEAVDAAGAEVFSVSASIGQDEETRRSGQMEMLEELMGQLPERDRRILELSACYIEPNPPFRCLIPPDELGYLAKQIGVAPPSVKVLRGRAYEKLRKLAEAK